MSLYAQIYPNPSRTISGTITINNDDVVLYCDTSVSAVTINLISIPNSYWMTTWKLYVVDNSNNASTNNITINAPSGFLINGQASLTLNANNETALIRIVSNTDFIAYTSTANGSNLEVLNQGSLITLSASSMNFIGIQASASGSAVTVQNSYISGTYVQISALIASNSLIPSQGYQITNALYGTIPVKNIEVYLIATSTNELSLSGSGYFYNADYDLTGVYSGVSGYAGQLGIWALTLTPVVGNVCIWNNLHYVNITGSNGVTNPYVDTTNWSVLTYSTTNGYIAEVDTIKYDVANNRIIEREDVRYNSVTWCTVFAGYDSFNSFRWGDNKCYNNILNDSVLYNCNTLSNSLFNRLNSSSVIIGTTTLGGSTEMSDNEFIDCTVSIPVQATGLASEIFNRNIIKYSQLAFIKNTTSVAGTFSNNIVLQSSVTGVNYEGSYTLNTFQNATCTSLVNSTSNSIFHYNTIQNSTLTVTLNTSIITYNQIINDSFLTITQNTNSIKNNYVNQNSNVTIGINSNTINYNVLNSESTLNLANNSNLFINNYFINGSFICATSQSARVSNNQIQDSVITITTCNANVTNNNLKQTTITITTLGVSIGEVQTLSASLTPTTLSQSISGGIYLEGIATTSYVLDLNDATIFNAGTLTIPISIASFFGVYTLQNCSGQNITKVVTNNFNNPIRFMPDANTVIFTRTAIGAATSNDIVASTATATYTLTYRVNGNDSLEIKRLGNLNGVIETEIYV